MCGSEEEKWSFAALKWWILVLIPHPWTTQVLYFEDLSRIILIHFVSFHLPSFFLAVPPDQRIQNTKPNSFQILKLDFTSYISRLFEEED